jgi:hypothetical protein
MKRCALLLALASLFTFQLRAEPVEQVERPQLNVGDRWLYRVVDLWNGRETKRRELAVVQVNDTRVRLNERTTAINDVPVTSPRSVVIGTSAWPHANPRPINGTFNAIDFPLYVGKKWTMEYTLLRPNGNASDITERRDVTVEGWETITVPAGEFRTLRIVHEGLRMLHVSDGIFGSPTREVYWYAPELKLYVKRAYSNRRFQGSLLDQYSEELMEASVSDLSRVASYDEPR